MGALSKALKAPSSNSAKKTDLWADLVDRIQGAMLDSQLEDIEQWLMDYPLNYPPAWAEPLAEMIEVKREELRAEDIGEIVRSRFDF